MNGTPSKLQAPTRRLFPGTKQGGLTAFKDPALGRIAARLAGDEAAHFALLNLFLKRPLSKAFTFGA